MKYRRVGSSGLKVSEIGLGSWLTFGGSIDTDMSTQIIQYAMESGINFFDTANFYGLGEAEKVLGQALSPFPRHSYVLATKVFFPMGDELNNRGLSRKHIMEQCEASLKRLNVDYIDLYQCHRYDDETSLEETLRAMDDLVTQGKILYYGVSKWNAQHISDMIRIAEKCNLHKPISNQSPYNLLDRDIEAQVIPLCEREGIGQLVYSPLAQGVLSGKYNLNGEVPIGSRADDLNGSRWISRYLNRENLEKVEILRTIASKLGITLAQLSLAWDLRLNNISTCIFGATSIEQLEENIQATQVELTPEIIKDIEYVLNEVYE